MRGTAGVAPVGKARLTRKGADVTIVATLLMADRSLTAAALLADQGIDAEVLDLAWLRPLDTAAVAESVSKTGRLVIAEEQVHAAGWGATLISELTMRGIEWKRPPCAVSLSDQVLIPYSPSLEDQVVPSVERIAEVVADTCGKPRAL